MIGLKCKCSKSVLFSILPDLINEMKKAFSSTEIYLNVNRASHNDQKILHKLMKKQMKLSIVRD